MVRVWGCGFLGFWVQGFCRAWGFGSAGDDGTFVKRLLAGHSRTWEVRSQGEGYAVQEVP